MNFFTAALTSLTELVYPSLWWYTYMLFDFDSAVARGNDFKSKGDKLSSSAEYRIGTLEVWDTKSPEDWMLLNVQS